MERKSTKLKLINILAAILLISIIYQSGTVQASNNPDDFFFRISRILMLVAPILMCIGSSDKYNKKYVTSLVVMCIVLEALAAVNYFLYSESAGTLQFKILNFVLFFLSIYIAEKSSVNLYALLYKIIIIIAVITLAFYIAVDLVHLPIPYSVFYRIQGSTFTYRNYFNIYYTYSRSTIPRLCGLFWEPGVYQIYLNLALFLYYKLKIKNKLHLVVLLLNILFAQSTTGYMLAVIMVIAIIISQRRTSLSMRYLIRIIGIIAAFVTVLIIFINKRNATNVAGDSYFDRIAQATLGLRLFIENPIFGKGFYNTVQYGILNRAGSGNSNGLVTWLYTTGLVGLSFALLPFFWNIFREKNRNYKVEKIVWLVFILFENMSEPIYALPIMVFALASEYSQMIAKRKKYRNGINLKRGNALVHSDYSNPLGMMMKNSTYGHE